MKYQTKLTGFQNQSAENKAPACANVSAGIVSRDFFFLAEPFQEGNYKSSYIQNHLIAGKRLPATKATARSTEIS